MIQPTHRTYVDDDEDFDSSPAVSGRIVDIEWKCTKEEMEDLERRDTARKQLGGFGFRA